MIAFILSWSFAPAVSVAFFIKPGKPITPGEAITPGQPINGGQFIIPGDPISGGKSYLPGSGINGGKNPVSGQPIIPQYQGITGKFIIPNVAIPPGQWSFNGSPITGGEGPSGGQGLTGGTGPSGGQGLTGGTGPSGGQGLTGGTGPSGGQGLTGGEGPNGGQGLTGGTGPNGGQGLTGGTGPNGGEGQTGGTGPNGGQGLTGGTGPNGGQGSAGGTGPNGGEGQTGGTGANGGQGSTGGTGNDGEHTVGDSSPSLLNTLFKSTDTSGGLWGMAGGLLKDLNTWGTSFIKPLLEGGAAAYAGFNFQEYSSGKFKPVGKANISNKFFNYFYNNYRYYDFHGDRKHMRPGADAQDPAKVKAFFDSKNLAQTKKDFFKATWNNLKSTLNENYNVASKSFRSLSNLANLNGPIGIVGDLVTNFSKKSWNGKILTTSDKLANFTLDLGIGALTTAASSIAASMATGAVAGSVAPGVGTIIGAVAGFTTGILITLGIDKTPAGRRAKDWVSGKLSSGYSYIGKGAKNIWNNGKGLWKSTIKRFGFG